MGSPPRRRAIVLLVVAAICGGVYWATRAPDVDPKSTSNGGTAGDGLARPGASGTGSSGAGPTGTAAAKKPKPPLDVPRIASLPGTLARQDILIKPGHWTATWVEAESTDGDFRGILDSGVRNARGELIPLVPQSRRLSVERSVVIPKGDPRVAEQWLFAPNDYDRVYENDIYFPRARLTPIPRETIESELSGATLALSLTPTPGRFAQYQASKPTGVMRHHQALFVVLAGKPHDYRMFGRLQTVLATPPDDTPPIEETAHYRFVVADDPRRAPLATHFAGWTTTALLIWDDYDPQLLTEDQRRALVDWLHWGGRMVISGPDSLDKLSKSFLEPYLPARSLGSRELGDAALSSLDTWTNNGANAVRAKPWRGVELTANENGRTLVPGVDDKGPLVVERQVGRGRIAVTAFRVAQPELTEWRSFDGFLNCCLFGRPGRTWVGDVALGHKTERPYWSKKPRASWYDPRDISDVRYAVRDPFTGSEVAMRTWIGPGTAAWRDDGPVVDAARALLKEEAGIVIPSARFVVGIIGLYLLALVPLNWIVFRLMGKVEWAWFASPVIAVGFTVAVVRIAELDIGFARSQTEIAVVELQPGYSRAHVSRIGAVYNSLGTDYTVASRDPSAVILPFAASTKKQDGPDGTMRLIRPDRSDAAETSVELKDFAVESNSTSMYRAEQMIDLGGAIRFELLSPNRARLTNDSTLALEDIRLSGTFTGRADSLGPKESIEIDRREAVKPADDARTRRGDLSDAAQLVEGDTLRFVAWSKSTIDGLALQPTPSQQRRMTLIVGHLDYAPLERARDANIPVPRKLDDLLNPYAP
jgi:hypothetical protein